MKKIIVVILMISLSMLSFSQQTVSIKTSLSENYLSKSKKQKKIAWILLGSGAAVLITGAVIPRGEPTGDINYFTLNKEYKNDGLKGSLGAIGAAGMLSSIPFFIASGKNKRRALSVSFRFQQTPPSQKSFLAKRQIPSLSLKLNL